MSGATTGKPKKGLTVALHGHSGSNHVVGIGNLHVLIVKDKEDQSWFAQGLEIDYAAEGASQGEVRQNFQNGLTSTIREHLKVYGSIETLLQVAPREAWIELYKAAKVATHSQFSVHKLSEFSDELPFEGIQYIEQVVNG